MVPTRFAVAAHILLLLASDEQDTATSLRIARSVNTNPVVVRRITGQLSRAGLIHVRRGPGGAALLRPASQITLADIWQAVNSGTPRPLLPVHANPDQACPVGCRIHAVLSDAFGAAERALTGALGDTTLADLLHGMAEAA